MSYPSTPAKLYSCKMLLAWPPRSRTEYQKHITNKRGINETRTIPLRIIRTMSKKGIISYSNDKMTKVQQFQL